VGAGEGGGVGSASASGIDHTSAMTVPGFLKGIGPEADPAEPTGLVIVSMAAEPALPFFWIHSPGHSKRRAPQRGNDKGRE